ncbi:PREDICTED: uncharacterized protein LOC109227164 [Nicotiana attenuata]|uniref:Uncharacterized protein n=1 Tax=Nicotiana attenuata TaxID=49451 RepID=A0A1J6J5B1_NICAT|nr:PREDICTED: uncharacterized protein LOC109227164 [Nicotiana attenuata]OIT02449.1 hypothetical protein A4A49_34050 [Nicotiana attenuata]
MTEGVFTITATDNDNSRSQASIISNYNIDTRNDVVEQPLQPNGVINNGERLTDDVMRKKKKKKPGVFGLFKAAMFVLRHGTKGKQKAAQVAVSSTKGDWKKLVGSMRPLHLQDNNSRTPSQTAYDYCATASPSALSCSGTMSQYASANDLQALDVPAAAPSITDSMSQYASANDLQALEASTSSGTMSQYASANNLQELDDEEEEEDPDQVFDAIGADDMIDAKAEEFILQFYQQMRRQNIDSMSGQFN